MVVIDIPIEFDQGLLVFIGIDSAKRPGIKPVFGLENVDDVIDIGLCYAGNVLNRLRV